MFFANLNAGGSHNSTGALYYLMNTVIYITGMNVCVMNAILHVSNEISSFITLRATHFTLRWRNQGDSVSWAWEMWIVFMLSLTWYSLCNLSELYPAIPACTSALMKLPCRLWTAHPGTGSTKKCCPRNPEERYVECFSVNVVAKIIVIKQ